MTLSRIAFFSIGVALAAFHVYTAAFGVLESFTQRSVHLMLVTAAVLAATFGLEENSRPWRVALRIGAVALIAPLLYNIWFGDVFANRMAYVVPLDWL